MLLKKKKKCKVSPDQATIVKKYVEKGGYVLFILLENEHLKARAKMKRLFWLLCRYKWADKETIKEHFCWMTLKLKCMVLILSLMTKTTFMIQTLTKLTSLN